MTRRRPKVCHTSACESRYLKEQTSTPRHFVTQGFCFPSSSDSRMSGCSATTALHPEMDPNDLNDPGGPPRRHATSFSGQGPDYEDGPPRRLQRLLESFRPQSSPSLFPSDHFGTVNSVADLLCPVAIPNMTGGVNWLDSGQLLLAPFYCSEFPRSRKSMKLPWSHARILKAPSPLTRRISENSSHVGSCNSSRTEAGLTTPVVTHRKKYCTSYCTWRDSSKEDN